MYRVLTSAQVSKSLLGMLVVAAGKHFHKACGWGRVHPASGYSDLDSFCSLGTVCKWFYAGRCMYGVIPQHSSSASRVLLRMALFICVGSSFLLTPPTLEGQWCHPLGSRRTCSDLWQCSFRWLPPEPSAPDSFEIPWQSASPAISPSELLLHSEDFPITMSNYKEE